MTTYNSTLPTHTLLTFRILNFISVVVNIILYRYNIMVMLYNGGCFSYLVHNITVLLLVTQHMFIFIKRCVI